MRSVGPATLGIGAVIGLVTLSATAHALTGLTVDKCLASQLKIVGKGAAAYAACHAKAAAKGVPTDADCLAKAAAKIGPALAKLEAKKACLVEGTGSQRAIDAAAYAEAVDATVGHAAGKCDTAKTKLAGKSVAALAGCYAKAAGKAGTVDGKCVAKAAGRLAAGIARAETKSGCSHTGQTTTLVDAANAFVDAETCVLDPESPGCVPPATPTPTVTATPVCNNGVNDPGEPCDPSAPSAGWGACSPDATCTDCTCACPTTMTFSSDAESVLDLGWTGVGHREPLVDGSDLTVQLACPATTHPCGTCTVTGPIANPHAGAGQLDSRRCDTNAAKKCTSDAACAARACLGGANDGAACAADSECPSGSCPVAGVCTFYDGSALPLSAGGVAVCVLHRFEGGITGTADVDAGEAALGATLDAQVYFAGVLGSPVDAPCPRCSDAGGINDGVSGGTCDAGPRVGLACDANGTVPGRPDFGRPSLDCPPAPSAIVATLAVALQNATDPVTRTLTPASTTCSGSVTDKCLCSTCNDADAEPCGSDADCPPSGGSPGVCGGRRCVAGGNAGAPCSASSECPGGACTRPGEPTRPNSCLETCEPLLDSKCADPDDDGEGACIVGPNDQTCSLASGHGQRGCTTDADCGGGAGACESNPRRCFLTGRGTFQSGNWGYGTDTLIAVGRGDAPVAGVSHPTLASVFCLGPTSHAALNNVFGLPGPARVTIEGTVRTSP